MSIIFLLISSVIWRSFFCLLWSRSIFGVKKVSMVIASVFVIRKSCELRKFYRTYSRLGRLAAASDRMDKPIAAIGGRTQSIAGSSKVGMDQRRGSAMSSKSSFF